METKDMEITIIDLLQPKVFPEPYAPNNMEKHGTHDQKKHGNWADGVGDYNSIFPQIEGLREKSREAREKLDEYMRSKGLPGNYQTWNSDPTAKKLRDDEINLWKEAAEIEKKFYDEYFGGSPDTSEFQKLRDEYVVADTPTLSMNRNLRGKNPRITQRIKNADEMCASGSVKKDVGVFRGAVLPKEMLDKLSVGSTYVDKGFQSTDLSMSMAKFYAESRQNSGGAGVLTLLKMTLKEGLNAVDVGYGEIVVQRNANMKVTGKSEADGYTIIDVEVSK